MRMRKNKNFVSIFKRFSFFLSFLFVIILTSKVQIQSFHNIANDSCCDFRYCLIRYFNFGGDIIEEKKSRTKRRINDILDLSDFLLIVASCFCTCCWFIVIYKK